MAAGWFARWTAPWQERWAALRERRLGVGGRIALGAVAVAVLGGAPWWGPLALSRLDYFHVRRIAFDGTRFARTRDLLPLLAVDTLESVWQPLPPLADRLLTHPLVAAARVERRLPGTLVITVEEREPVALVPQGGRLAPADGDAHILPIDLAAHPLDLPVVATVDTAALRVLDALRRDAPTLYARVTQVSRPNAQELRFALGALVVRTRPEVTVARFRDILLVEADLARQQRRALELDLRFRDQVIARQP
ncbi:MAG: FtsQ-type POTRA domain-containing protein [Gemmatimonadetes bacterium]|nr:FtsQ-type POTRA domain-containing protein [Gemmatimonadota bacterium]